MKTIDPSAPQKYSYSGLFLVAFSTLMYEILLTRVFSVTMWFHFAFVAISLAMFGMTVGATLVYLYPALFEGSRTKKWLAASSLALAVTMVLGFVAHLYIPFVTKASWKNLTNIALTYTLISVPFVFSGIAVSLALTKFPKKIGKLYAADLAGAALGCAALVWLLNKADASSCVFIIAGFAAIAAILFAKEALSKTVALLSVLFCLGSFSFAFVNAYRAAHDLPFLRIVWVKGTHEAPPHYEKWNSFSRITIADDPNGKNAFGWGISTSYKAPYDVDELWLRIDSGAATPITRFDGDLTRLDHLKHDVTNAAHYLKQDAKVLVVGVGGGRDILSALAFDQKSVTGVEINKTIIDVVNKRYGAFSGHLDRDPKVKFVNDEARSFVARSKELFDIIQVSFIDTNAATAAGAFVFTENSLYTVEAWKAFLEHLTPDGVLTFSRWYHLDLSGEVYRMITLAVESLKTLGINDPRQHILIVKNKVHEKDVADVGTILISKAPFTKDQVAKLEEACKVLDFEIMLSPYRSADPVFETLTSGGDNRQFMKNFPIMITAPTDDNPFFFCMVRLKDSFNKKLWGYKLVTFNMKALFVLGALSLTVLVLTFICVFLPLFFSARKFSLSESLAPLAYFAGIGFGFMFVEISQMQRLIIFLGHPVYGLSVVLFTLLLSSSLGSFSVRHIEGSELAAKGKRRLALLLGALLLFGLFTTNITHAFQASTTPVRIFISILILSPLGFFMGTAFPLGMKAASGRTEGLMPWLWGANGAASVCASVFAVAIALNAGISSSYWTGFAAYLVSYYSMTRLATK